MLLEVPVREAGSVVVEEGVVVVVAVEVEVEVLLGLRERQVPQQRRETRKLIKVAGQTTIVATRGRRKWLELDFLVDEPTSCGQLACGN